MASGKLKLKVLGMLTSFLSLVPCLSLFISVTKRSLKFSGSKYSLFLFCLNLGQSLSREGKFELVK